VRDLFRGTARVKTALEYFRKNGSGVLVYLRDGAAGVPVAPLAEPTSAEAMRNQQWREVGVGAQILRDLGVSSIRHLTSSAVGFKGLAGLASRSSRPCRSTSNRIDATARPALCKAASTH